MSDSAWRDIETAPKDGTRVLVFDGVVVIARFWGGAFRVGDLPGSDCYPTHWMPLPPPPEAE